MMRNVEIRGRSKEPCRIFDEALNNFLPLPVVRKGSILNVVEFLDLSLKTWPCAETSPVSCERVFFLIISKCGRLFQKSLLRFTV